MRLIDADDFIEKLAHVPLVQDAMKKALDQMPTIEQRKGHWININEGIWNTCTVLKCSVCGEMDNRMYWTDNFCPHCGADMRKDL